MRLIHHKAMYRLTHTRAHAQQKPVVGDLTFKNYQCDLAMQVFLTSCEVAGCMVIYSSILGERWGGGERERERETLPLCRDSNDLALTPPLVPVHTWQDYSKCYATFHKSTTSTTVTLPFTCHSYTPRQKSNTVPVKAKNTEAV